MKYIKWEKIRTAGGLVKLLTLFLKFGSVFIRTGSSFEKALLCTLFLKTDKITTCAFIKNLALNCLASNSPYSLFNN